MILMKKTTKEVTIKGELGTLLEVKEVLKDFEVPGLKVKLDPDFSFLTMTYERGSSYGE